MNAATAEREAAVERMIRDCLAQFAAELRGWWGVWFGSRAADRTGPGADFDLGVIGPAPLPLDTFYRIADALDALPTLYTVDWVDPQRASPELREAALSRCHTLYEG